MRKFNEVTNENLNIKDEINKQEIELLDLKSMVNYKKLLNVNK
jgi:hypothetical protein